MNIGKDEVDTFCVSSFLAVTGVIAATACAVGASIQGPLNSWRGSASASTEVDKGVIGE